jgi:YjbE family integral membrane protein
VIGLAARHVPKGRQKLVIGLGTIGAIFIRVIATLAVAWLLKVPGLHLIGGVLLVWIAYKLLVNKKEHHIDAKDSVLAAVATIMVADAAMGLDNVLAVAGAAHGDYTLVMTGLALSVPLVVWGSTLILRLTSRFPWIIKIGAGVLAYTAGSMITSEPVFQFLFENMVVKWGFILLTICGVLWAGRRKQVTLNKIGEQTVM